MEYNLKRADVISDNKHTFFLLHSRAVNELETIYLLFIFLK